jgi:hypothetical protein
MLIVKTQENIQQTKPPRPPAKMATVPTDVAARSVRATLSFAVDHVHWARATPNAVELINNVTANATCSSQRFRPVSQYAALTEHIRKLECVGDEISVAAGKGEERDMIDVRQGGDKRYNFKEVQRSNR